MKIIKTFTKCAVMPVAIVAAFTISSFAQSPKLTDPEIASIAVTANQVDINNAAVAKEISKNATVLKFAETMTNDHKAVIAQAVALVTKLKVTPKDNAISQSLLADNKKTDAMLRTKTGAEFDKAYVDNEVAYHKAVIADIETLLVPQAQNAELKALLVKVLPAFKAHLAHAEMVQKSLSK